MTDFTDMENRILDRLDKLDEKIQDICNRVGRIEQYHNDQDSHKGDRQWSWNKFFGIAGVMGMTVAVILSIL